MFVITSKNVHDNHFELWILFIIPFTSFFFLIHWSLRQNAGQVGEAANH